VRRAMTRSLLVHCPCWSAPACKLALENHTETFADESPVADRQARPSPRRGLPRHGQLHGRPRKPGNRRQKARTHTLFATTSATTSSTGTSSASGSTGSPWATGTSTASKPTGPSGNCHRPTASPLRSSGTWAQDSPWKSLGRKRWMPASGASNYAREVLKIGS
jgi:hypothetical protein